MNDFPWPLEKPEVRPQVKGWNSDENLTLFNQHLGPSTRVIVELGVWLGQSTLEFLRLARESTIVCVDHWLGSEEHQTHSAWSAELPALRETFLANVWDYRSRVVVISDKTTSGLKIINDHRISPDFIYVDASHRFEDVKADIEMADYLFPNAILAGDDFDWEDVNVLSKVAQLTESFTEDNVVGGSSEPDTNYEIEIQLIPILQNKEISCASQPINGSKVEACWSYQQGMPRTLSNQILWEQSNTDKEVGNGEDIL